jgi:hypothetical protein
VLPVTPRTYECARLDSNQQPPPSQGGALFPLSYGRSLKPPAGVEPAPRPYKGRVLAVDTTEARVETVGVEPTTSSLQARCSATRASSPSKCGRMESNHHSARHPVYSRESSPMLSVREIGAADRTRTDTCGAHNPGCCVTPRPPRNTGTTGLEPASSRLTSERSARLSYAPKEGGRRDRLPATGGRDVTVLGLRSQLLLIGTPASACPRRHLLTGWPWRLSEASCTLGPALCTSPSSVTSLARPSTRQS